VKLEMDKDSKETRVYLKSGVVDGVNVRRTYRMVPYSDIGSLLSKVDSDFYLQMGKRNDND